MIYVCLADGFEEMEAIAPIDILRRAGLTVVTAGVTGKTVTGSHGVPVTADITIGEMDLNKMQALLLPGGMPGTRNLEQSEEVKRAILAAVEKNCLLAAICAAPSILGHMGLLQGKEATCFPGYEKELHGARLSQKPVCRDGSIITAKGAGVALEFGLQAAAYMTSDEKSQEIRASLQCIK